MTDTMKTELARAWDDLPEQFKAHPGVKRLRAALDSQAAQAQPSGWISADERLPDDCQEVLLWCFAIQRGEDDEGRYIEQDVSQVCMGRCVRDSYGIAYLENYSTPFADSEVVTHWMPLPASPSPNDLPSEGENAHTKPAVSTQVGGDVYSRLRQALEHCEQWLPADCAAAIEARETLDYVAGVQTPDGAQR